MVLRRSLLATDDSVRAERDRLLEQLNRFKLENERIMKLILELDAVMKGMSTCFVDMKKNLATVKTENWFLVNFNAELLSLSTRKGAKSTRMEDNYIKTIPSTCLGFALHTEMVIALHGC